MTKILYDMCELSLATPHSHSTKRPRKREILVEKNADMPSDVLVGTVPLTRAI
jgi:hypothetical protein